MRTSAVRPLFTVGHRQRPSERNFCPRSTPSSFHKPGSLCRPRRPGARPQEVRVAAGSPRVARPMLNPPSQRVTPAGEVGARFPTNLTIPGRPVLPPACPPRVICWKRTPGWLSLPRCFSYPIDERPCVYLPGPPLSDRPGPTRLALNGRDRRCVSPESAHFSENIRDFVFLVPTLFLKDLGGRHSDGGRFSTSHVEWTRAIPSGRCHPAGSLHREGGDGTRFSIQSHSTMPSPHRPSSMDSPCSLGGGRPAYILFRPPWAFLLEGRAMLHAATPPAMGAGPSDRPRCFFPDRTQVSADANPWSITGGGELIRPGRTFFFPIHGPAIHPAVVRPGSCRSDPRAPRPGPPSLIPGPEPDRRGPDDRAWIFDAVGGKFLLERLPWCCLPLIRPVPRGRSGCEFPSRILTDDYGGRPLSALAPSRWSTQKGGPEPGTLRLHQSMGHFEVEFSITTTNLPIFPRPPPSAWVTIPRRSPAAGSPWNMLPERLPCSNG